MKTFKKQKKQIQSSKLLPKISLNLDDYSFFFQSENRSNSDSVWDMSKHW